MYNWEILTVIMEILHFGSVKVFFSLCLLLCCTSLLGQGGTSRSEFWSKVRYGGGLGLGFGSGTFNAGVSPSAIYQINDQFAAGVSLGFNYAKFDENKLVAYGGSIITLYNPLHFLQLSAEMEQLRVNRTLAAPVGEIEDNYWSPALFLGVGYTSYNVTFGVRYDLLYSSKKSIYTSALMPFVRVYF